MKRRVVVTIAALVLLASACTGGAGETSDRPGRVPKYPEGGTLRVASEHYSYDPQASYAAADWEVLRCCLLRMLFTYNGRPTEEGGAILRPDLATGMGSPSPGWLDVDLQPEDGDPLRASVRGDDHHRRRHRPGVSSEPEISSARVSGVPRTPPTTRSSTGSRAFEAGTVDSISGITVSDDRTLVVRLTRPAGDLPYLFAMPATAPIPEGAAHLATDRDYERFLVSSGPYMFEGSPDLDFSVAPVPAGARVRVRA